MRALKNKLSRLLELWPMPQKTMDSQMHRITRKLIKGSVGPNGTVTRAFRKQLKQYSAEKNPLGRDEALNILVGLVLLAVAERSKLEGTIVDQVERGLLYSDYYRDVKKVSEEATKTDEYYRKAEMIREDYLIEYGFYDRNRMASHRKGSTEPLSEDDLNALKARIDKLNKFTGFGGDKE